jgi:hypothetical protein
MRPHPPFPIGLQGVGFPIAVREYAKGCIFCAVQFSGAPRMRYGVRWWIDSGNRFREARRMKGCYEK